MPSSILPVGHPYYSGAPPLVAGKRQPVGVWPGVLPQLTRYDAPFSGQIGTRFTFLGGSGAQGTQLRSYGSGVLTAASVRIPTSGIWKIRVSACLTAVANTEYIGQMHLTIDQIPVQVPPAVVTADSHFTYKVTNISASHTVFADYFYYVPILAGDHQIQLKTLGATGRECWVDAFDISLLREGLPLEPVGVRDPTLQPMSSHHFVNTPLGSGAVWSAQGDSDTQLVITGSYGALNSAQWSVPVYKGSASDPLQTWQSVDTIYVPHGNVSLRMPPGMVVSPPADYGGDHAIALFGSDRRFMFSGFNATVNQSPTQPGVYIGRDQISDMYNGFNHATGQGSSQIPGLIRSWEVLAGSIKHMLCMGLSASILKAVPSPWTGLVWPNWESDYNGAFGQYTGGSTAIQYGITIGIPSSVNIATLGLSASGLVLARCMQDYGAFHAIQAGAPNPNVTLYAEQDVSAFTPQLIAMQADWHNIILRQCRILRNQGPLTINGGGTRRQALAEGVRP